jgi:Bacterial Ig-like domain
LARDLSALFALLLRWLELVRTLRLALTTAQALGDRPTEAWALHELGSLHLAAGEPETAAKYLHQALEVEQGLAGYGRCATRHNLDAAERDTAERNALRKARRRRRLRFVGTGAVIVLLASGGTALGVGVPYSNTSAQLQPPPTEPTTTQLVTGPSTTTQRTTTHSTTASHTPGTTRTTTTTRTNRGDTTPPSLELTAPSGYLNTDTPTFSGRGGLARGDLATITLTVSTADPTQVERLTIQRDPVSGQFSFTPPTRLPEGSYTAVVTQSDQFGNVGRSNQVSFTIDLTAPTVSFTSPRDGGITKDPTPTFDGTAGTLPGDDPTITITVSVFDGTTQSWSALETLKPQVVDGEWTTTSTIALGQGGRYQAVASQSDRAGNTGTVTISFSEPPA